MFTGIVEGIGTIVKAEKINHHVSLTVENQELFQSPHLGCSIAINGVCLTQSAWKQGLSTFDVIDETLNVTNLSLLREGDEVNVERALKADSRIEGHVVQGHVDGVGHIQKIDLDRNEIYIEIPDSLEVYVIHKGSITIDGISLTIASIKEDVIRIALTPHTLKMTILKNKRVGDPVNLEVDLFAKYVCKYLDQTALQKGVPL